MFMGNFSKNPAKAVHLTLSAAGTIKTSTVDKCKEFADWKTAFAHSPIAKKGTEILHGLIPNGPDKPQVFLQNMLSSLWGSCPGTP